jgi:hypothetical protein
MRFVQDRVVPLLTFALVVGAGYVTTLLAEKDVTVAICSGLLTSFLMVFVAHDVRRLFFSRRL